MDIFMGLLLIAVSCFLSYLAIDAARDDTDDQ